MKSVIQTDPGYFSTKKAGLMELFSTNGLSLLRKEQGNLNRYIPQYNFHWFILCLQKNFQYLWLKTITKQFSQLNAVYLSVN